jgi:uncharacterized protein
VYVDEAPFGAAAIAGVPTSTAAFVGGAARGPAGKAVEVRSLAEYERVFGSLEPRVELGWAVSQFFSAGGSEARVVGVPEGIPLTKVLPALDAARDIGLLCLPGEEDVDVLLAGLAYAERRRAFLVVDPPGVESERALALVRALASRSGTAGASGAVYYPPVEVPDPHEDGAQRTCSPAGAVAGLYALTDRVRGVWKAPAGPHAFLQGVAAAAVDLSEREVSALTDAGLNCIRRVPRSGIRVWGSRTLAAGQGETEWKYVNLRRFFVFLEASIEGGTQWAVFEPNDEPVWARLRLQVAIFLDELFRSGAFPGETPAEAYFVRCGPETMTQNDLDNGRLALEVGVAPARPAEFVVFRIERKVARTVTESLDATGRPSERLGLGRRSVRSEGVFVQVREPEGWVTWTPVDRLEEQGPEDRVYVLDREAGELRFGDGKHGARPPAGADVVRATYRFGSGRAGT